jgi:hypothetical protein
MDKQNNFGPDRNRYNIVDNQNSRRRLPLLNRGVRDLSDISGRDIDTEIDSEDTLSEPTCGELRRMWRIARRIHQHAIETNEIPQELHPFSNFEADRFRAERRFGRVNMGLRRINGLRGFRPSKARQSEDSDKIKEKNISKGSKEFVMPDDDEQVFGTIKSAPGDTVKRPRDRGDRIRDVFRLSHMPKPGKYNPYSPVDRDTFVEGQVREFSPVETTTRRPIHRLHDENRKAKGLPPLKTSDYPVFGKPRNFHKPKPKSSLDILLESMRDGRSTSSSQPRASSRLNYRDDSSSAIQPAAMATSYGQQIQWDRRKSRKNKKRRKNVS